MNKLGFLIVALTISAVSYGWVIKESKQDEDVKIVVNDGGVYKEAIVVSGATGQVSFDSPLASGSVDSTSIVDGTIANTDISAGANISGTKIATDSITSSQIGVDAVGASELANNSVASANVVDNTLVAADIAADAIEASELADNSVASANIIADTIVAADIATGAVGTAEILDGTITNTDINSISTSVISDVTSGNISATDETCVSNCDACTVDNLHYARVGSIVSIAFRVIADPNTISTTDFVCDFDPPIASNLVGSYNAKGSCIHTGDSDLNAFFWTDAGAGNEDLRFVISSPAHTGSISYVCSGVYIVQ